MLEADVKNSTFKVEGLPSVWETETGDNGQTPAPYTCRAGSIIKASNIRSRSTGPWWRLFYESSRLCLCM